MDLIVSISMVTYNQERYIGQAIESVLIQKVNFPYEIVIGEDCSTDGTLNICRAYQEKYPDKIRLLERKKNLGTATNFLMTLKECKGKYIAILEGDDFWIDPLKLQKQVDFLDTWQDFALVFTRTLAFFQDEDHPEFEIPAPESGQYDIESLLRNNFIANCSVMYRNGLVNNFPEWLYHLDMQDWPLHILHAQYGKIGFINEPMAKYRIHSKSYYSSRKVIPEFKGILIFYRTINRYLNFKYGKLIYRMQAKICNGIAICSASEKNWIDGFHYKVLAFSYLLLSYLPHSILTLLAG